MDFTIATNAGRLSRCDGPATLQSLADFFYFELVVDPVLSSLESLWSERSEVRRQIAELEAEAEQAKIDDENQGHS